MSGVEFTWCSDSFPVSLHLQFFGVHINDSIWHLDGSRARPRDTVKPLADSLGLQIDTRIDRDDSAGVAQAVNDYHGDGNILICWEHGQLQDILQALGVADAPAYPGTR